MNPRARFLAVLGLMLLGPLTESRAERGDRDQPLQLEADRASMDDTKQISIFEGNVRLVQGTLVIRGDKIVVTETRAGFRHGTVTGNLASFRQKLDDSEEWAEGSGERIEYDTQSEVLELYNRASMKRGQDEVRGDHITYNSRQTTFVATGKADQKSPDQGRVRAVFQPKTAASAPAATPTAKP